MKGLKEFERMKEKEFKRMKCRERGEGKGVDTYRVKGDWGQYCLPVASPAVPSLLSNDIALVTNVILTSCHNN